MQVIENLSEKCLIWAADPLSDGQGNGGCADQLTASTNLGKYSSIRSSMRALIVSPS